MEMTFDPSATRAFAARILRRLVEGPAVLALTFVVLLPVLVGDGAGDMWSRLFVAVILLLMTILVAHGFIHEKLESDAGDILRKHNSACYLSSDILVSLPSGAKTAYDLVASVVQGKRGAFIVHEMGIRRERFLQMLKPLLDSEPAGLLVQEAMHNMDRFHITRVDPGCLLFTLFQRPGMCDKILNALDIALRDLEMIVRWEQYHAAVWHKEPFWTPAGLVRTLGGFGRSWVTGYNDTLDAITAVRIERETGFFIEREKSTSVVLYILI